MEKGMFSWKQLSPRPPDVTQSRTLIIQIKKRKRGKKAQSGEMKEQRKVQYGGTCGSQAASF